MEGGATQNILIDTKTDSGPTRVSTSKSPSPIDRDIESCTSPDYLTKMFVWPDQGSDGEDSYLLAQFKRE